MFPCNRSNMLKAFRFPTFVFVWRTDNACGTFPLYGACETLATRTSTPLYDSCEYAYLYPSVVLLTKVLRATSEVTLVLLTKVL